MSSRNIQQKIFRSGLIWTLKINYNFHLVFYSLASWNWHHVQSQLVVTMFVIASGLAKLGFHKAHWLSSRVPESCLLIILGVAFGGQ